MNSRPETAASGASDEIAKQQKTILDALPAHIALLDAQGTIVLVNEAWRNFARANLFAGFNYGIGTNYIELCEAAHGDKSCEAEAVARGIRAVIAREVPEFSIEYPCHSPDRKRWFRMMASKIGSGTTVGAVVMHIDITERKLSEEALRDSERMQRELAERLRVKTNRLVEAQAVAKVGSWETNFTTLEVTWSDETHRIFETDPSSFMPTHTRFLSLVHPEDREKVDTAFRNSFLHRDVCAIEHRILLADGGIKYVRERWKTFVDDHDRPTLAIGTCQDIDMVKRLEIALAQSEERFRHVAEVTSDVFWDWDLETGAVWFSQGMQTTFGYPPNEIIEDISFWRDRVHPADRETLLASIETHLAEGDTHWQHEYLFRKKDGSYAHVLEQRVVVRDIEKRNQRIIAGLRDVTRKLELEDQLRQAQRLEAVGQLTGGVAHDFNNLLTVVMGNADILVERLGADRQLQSLAEMVRTAASRGAELTHGLLAFARQQPLNPKVTDIGRLTQDIVPLIRRTVSERVEVKLLLGADLWPVEIDKSQLENAILNLVINARDAMPDGGTISIQIDNVTVDQGIDEQTSGVGPRPHVCLSIADTGSGMPPEVLNRVFEPFFTTKEVGKGSGLGLSMVYGFVKQSKGQIEIHSEVGKGMIVKLYLPRAEADREQQDVDVTQIVEPSIKGERILMVEDDDLVRANVAQLLARLGYQVETANNAADALTKLKAIGRVDLLFTDVVMPGTMTGPELAEEAQRHQTDLRVLFTSGYTDIPAADHGRLEPGRNLLSKPYRNHQLAAAIRKALQAPQGER